LIRSAMTSFTSCRLITGQIGPCAVRGTLCTAIPPSESIFEGTLTTEDLFTAPVVVRLDGPPVCLDIRAGLENLSVCIRLDPDSKELVGLVRWPNSESGTHDPERWQRIAAPVQEIGEP
jgi:hypothetical protein